VCCYCRQHGGDKVCTDSRDFGSLLGELSLERVCALAPVLAPDYDYDACGSGVATSTESAGCSARGTTAYEVIFDNDAIFGTISFTVWRNHHVAATCLVCLCCTSRDSVVALHD